MHPIVDFIFQADTLETSPVYICIFSCAMFRTCHFEVAPGTGTDDLKICINNFLARRPRSRKFISDRATGMIKSRADFEHIFSEEFFQEMQNFRFGVQGARS